MALFKIDSRCKPWTIVAGQSPRGHVVLLGWRPEDRHCFGLRGPEPRLGGGG